MEPGVAPSEVSAAIEAATSDWRQRAVLPLEDPID